MNRNGYGGEVTIGISLEDLAQAMVVEQKEIQLPEELIFGVCQECGQSVHPANNLFLLSDFVEGATMYYANGLAQHFVPVVAHGGLICPGVPAFYQFLEGVKLVEPLKRETDLHASQRAWQAAFQRAIAYATSGTECFQFSFKRGAWLQEYSCRIFMKEMGGLK